MDKDDLNIIVINNSTGLLSITPQLINPLLYGDYNTSDYNLTIASKSDAFGFTTIQVVTKDTGNLMDMSEFNVTVNAILDFPNISNEELWLSEDLVNLISLYQI